MLLNIFSRLPIFYLHTSYLFPFFVFLDSFLVLTRRILLGHLYVLFLDFLFQTFGVSIFSYFTSVHLFAESSVFLIVIVSCRVDKEIYSSAFIRQNVCYHVFFVFCFVYVFVLIPL